MNLKTIKKELLEFIKSESNPMKNNENNEITNCINLIIQDVELLQKEDNIDLSEITESDIIRRCILDLGEIVLETPLNDEFCKFISSFTELVFNWNNNTIKDDLIKILSLYINRIVESYTVLKNSSLNIRDTLETIRTLKQWTPPAFDLSEKYFDELINQIEQSNS